MGAQCIGANVQGGAQSLFYLADIGLLLVLMCPG